MNTSKIFKAALSVVVAAIMVLSSAAVCFAAETVLQSPLTAPDYVTNSTDKAIWVQGYNNETAKNIEAVKWYPKDGKYYLFLPTTTDFSSLIIFHNFTDLKIGGSTIVSGEKYSFIKEGSYTATADGNPYSLEIMKSDSVGTMFLTTDSGSMDYVHADKENKDPGYAVIVDNEGTLQYDNAMEYIKGRGNTTWTNIDKKPYNFKLSKKAGLLGMDKSKKWCLLANGQEHSMLRNKLMYDMADEVGLDYSVDSRFIDLYANGEYLGSYLLTQKIEVGTSELVALDNLEDKTVDAVKALTGEKDVDLSTYSAYSNNKRYGFNIPADPADITGSYLIEYVYGVTEPSGFVTKRKQSADIKSPEYCSVNQINYIADFVQDMEDALYSSTGYNAKGKHYTDYIDAESAARVYLLQEISVNIDCGISSCFLYKESDITGDGKLHFGPVWDFDVALGNLLNTKDGVQMTDNQSWFAKKSRLYNGGYTIIAAIARQSQMNDLINKVWNEEFVPAFDVLLSNKAASGRLQSLDTYAKNVSQQAKLNYVRWDYTLKDNLLVPEAGDTHEKQVEYLDNWLNGRFTFLNSKLTEITSVKTSAHNMLNDLFGKYREADYDSALWAQFKALYDSCITAIDSASSAAEVYSKLDSGMADMKNTIDNIVYFDNSQTKWSKCFVNYTGEADISLEMTQVPGNSEVYRVKLPENTDNFYFSNTNAVGEKQITQLMQLPSSGRMCEVDISAKTVDTEKQITTYSAVWSEYKVIDTALLGDVNLDGIVNLRDVFVFQQFNSDKIQFNDRQMRNADFNNDGKVNLRDAAAIQRSVAA